MMMSSLLREITCPCLTDLDFEIQYFTSKMHEKKDPGAEESHEGGVEHDLPEVVFSVKEDTVVLWAASSGPVLVV